MLTQLATHFFARSPVLAWPILALGIFFVVFVAVSVRALSRERDVMRRMAELPLQSNEGNQHE